MEKLGVRGHTSIINEYCNPFCRSPSLLNANTSVYVQGNKLLTHLHFRVNEKFLTSLHKIAYFKESDISYV